jgi:putative endonuclease
MNVWSPFCWSSADMTGNRVSLGKVGEDLACQELQRRGYEILARRYRRRRGELDIVARDGHTVVFVEVKARSGAAFGSGREAVTSIKRGRIVRIARDYLARHRLGGCPCRFDVVSIQFDAGEPAIDIISNAFDAGTS